MPDEAESLKLADILENYENPYAKRAAVELRRQHDALKITLDALHHIHGGLNADARSIVIARHAISNLQKMDEK